MQAAAKNIFLMGDLPSDGNILGWKIHSHLGRVNQAHKGFRVERFSPGSTFRLTLTSH